VQNYLHVIFEKVKNKLEYMNDIPLVLTVPKNRDHGDFSVNAAMLLTKSLKKNPRVIAEEIIAALDYDSKIIQDVKIAGPGFINFYFDKHFVSRIIPRIIEFDYNFGKSKKYSGKKAIVEFVSANPTGPLTVGHGRNAIIGDTTANMLEWIGYTVDREYYFNNAGRQMRVLGDSVRLRYLEILGDNIEFPEDYYQGEYISDIAKNLFETYSSDLRNEDAEGKFRDYAESEIFIDIKKTLKNINIEMADYFNEDTLFADGDIKKLLDNFKSENLSYEKDGATWFKLTELGMQQDKVIVKSTGEPTYRLPDIAYHIRKFERGYDLIVDVFGSDHNAAYPDVLAGCTSLGYDIEKVKVLIHQFVTIMQHGEIVKMSTRKANFITLDELINEVGKDVVRYFFIARNFASHLNFDIDLAKKQSDENPVFYLQYAHARICSILSMTKEENLSQSVKNLNLLIQTSEQNLLKKLNQFEKEVLTSSEVLEPHRITNYLEELASLFHRFYNECRILGTEKKLAEARIALCISVKIVIKNGLSILGVSAPEKM